MLGSGVGYKVFVDDSGAFRHDDATYSSRTFDSNAPNVAVRIIP